MEGADGVWRAAPLGHHAPCTAARAPHAPSQPRPPVPPHPTPQGYANPTQLAGGVHTRVFARAVVVAHAPNPRARVAFVSLDAGMAAQGVTTAVVAALAAEFGPQTYSRANVVLSGTHTHSGPGGYLTHALYQAAKGGRGWGGVWGGPRTLWAWPRSPWTQ